VLTVGCPIGFESIVSSVPDDMVPIGGIIAWSGAEIDIPNNYLLCNGACGSPDLRDKFIVGAGTTYVVGDSGGSASLIGNVDADGEPGDTGVDMSSGLLTEIADSLPPYHALCFIQRIS
jgi:hypothetical protein